MSNTFNCGCVAAINPHHKPLSNPRATPACPLSALLYLPIARCNKRDEPARRGLCTLPVKARILCVCLHIHFDEPQHVRPVPFARMAHKRAALFIDTETPVLPCSLTERTPALQLFAILSIRLIEPMQHAELV